MRTVTREERSNNWLVPIMFIVYINMAGVHNQNRFADDAELLKKIKYNTKRNVKNCKAILSRYLNEIKPGK